jgi:hypothetical protein
VQPDRLPIVKVVCPVAATCSIRRAYYKQVAVLTQILDDDLGDLVCQPNYVLYVFELNVCWLQGEGHIMSWFSPDGMQISENDEGTIYVGARAFTVSELTLHSDDYRRWRRNERPSAYKRALCILGYDAQDGQKGFRRKQPQGV